MREFNLVPEPGPEKEDDAGRFPERWLTFLHSNVFHYSLLSAAEQQRLLADAQTFITTKRYEGCRGFSITEEVEVTIAAQACLMLLGREHNCFGRVRTILVYPTGFQVVDDSWQDDGLAPLDASGQAINRGPVILAWDEVQAEGRDPSQGGNVVIHEFAHQLDFAGGGGSATFDFLGDQARQWVEILGTEFKRLRRKVQMGRGRFLGDYAAENEAEFFAVASERFFTLPEKLRQRHPALYDLLSTFYALDPARWFAKEADGEVAG